MIKIDYYTRLYYPFNARLGVPDYLNISNGAYFREPQYGNNVNIYLLRKGSNYIPIVSLLNNKRSDLKINESQFIRDNTTRILNNLYNPDERDDKKEMVENSLREFYKSVQGDTFLEYSRNIPTSLKNSWTNDYKRNASEYKSFLTSGEPGSAYFARKDDIVLHLFYYSLKGRILLTMVVYKNKALKFVNDLDKKEIHPDTCEIWIDKEFLYSKDRKLLHKFIREELLMSLFMKGFKIVEKDDILSELIYIPKYQLKSLDEYENIRNNLNTFLLSKL